MPPKIKVIDTDKLMELANEYIEHCLNSTKEYPTARGAVEVKERHLPTIKYFLYIWLRINDFDFYKKTEWYEAINNTEHPYHLVTKKIDDSFRALATDIVANEGKGIFYAKNYLGMTDKVITENTNNNTHTIKDITINIKTSGIEPITNEKDVKL
jgi:hypothetical protein